MLDRGELQIFGSEFTLRDETFNGHPAIHCVHAAPFDQQSLFVTAFGKLYHISWYCVTDAEQQSQVLATVELLDGRMGSC